MNVNSRAFLSSVATHFYIFCFCWGFIKLYWNCFRRRHHYCFLSPLAVAPSRGKSCSCHQWARSADQCRNRASVASSVLSLQSSTEKWAVLFLFFFPPQVSAVTWMDEHSWLFQPKPYLPNFDSLKLHKLLFFLFKLLQYEVWQIYTMQRYRAWRNVGRVTFFRCCFCQTNEWHWFIQIQTPLAF